MFKAKVITISDRCYRNEYEDLAGPVIKEMLSNASYDVAEIVIVPDEKQQIINELNKAVKEEYALIVTTGGTGFSNRDITPECTKLVIEKEAPGIAEYMRYKSMEITPRGMLSRGVCGIKNNSLIINLPGSPKAVKENLGFVLDSLEHGLKILRTDHADCANEN